MPRAKTKKISKSAAKAASKPKIVKKTREAPARKRVVPRKKTSVRSVRRMSVRSLLHKAPENPVLSPVLEHDWETDATFNPAAIYEHGKVHILYRAVGRGGVSVLGYASSRNGIQFDERLGIPAYIAPRGDHQDVPISTTRLNYFSGGGACGGCEDPRLVVIDGNVYLTYTAFDGWSSVRIAMATISLDDFLHKHWNWSKAVFLSPPGEVNKNWVMFPEKINGKFAFLHSISPNVQIDYVENLEDFDGRHFIKSSYTKVVRRGVWDSIIRGVGSPPIKTKHGWLVFYHATDLREPHLYKLGAMLLDLKDPSKILYRSQVPVLEPNEYYENSGIKAGIVYSCGAVVVNKQLLVYYGGADTVVCVAGAPLEEFLHNLVRTQHAKLQPIKS